MFAELAEIVAFAGSRGRSSELRRAPRSPTAPVAQEAFERPRIHLDAERIGKHEGHFVETFAPCRRATHLEGEPE